MPLQKLFNMRLVNSRNMNAPAIAREKPVLEALSGAKYSSQIAKEVKKTVPAKSTRIVIQLSYAYGHSPGRESSMSELTD